ncbi:hypothetical protein ELQ39_15855 [Streptomyces sp. GB4-14]|uniref:hypothetical protein n=1 Tax=Streptomyces sp. GB4-14 TaxID=2498703 RepID=UPI001F5ED023|nr:hypothetical protein [Streptomyces sp. GB4-14]
MSEPTNDDVEQIVHQAQKLDDLKQQIIAEMRARGEDPDDVRVIVGHRTADGDFMATELMTPAWTRQQTPPADDPDA